MGHEDSGDSQRVSVLPGDPADPESGEDRGVEIRFDPRDPESVRAAERLIQRRFGLAEAPPLCAEPRVGLLRRIVRSLTPAPRTTRGALTARIGSKGVACVLTGRTPSG